MKIGGVRFSFRARRTNFLSSNDAMPVQLQPLEIGLGIARRIDVVSRQDVGVEPYHGSISVPVSKSVGTAGRVFDVLACQHKPDRAALMDTEPLPHFLGNRNPAVAGD
jgi:hypothetical protein